MTELKKIFYIALFTFLGFIAQFLLHALIEIGYIKLLLTRYDIFGFGLEFSTWFVIHNVLTVILLTLGLAIGFLQGKYWWKRLYEQKNY